MDTQLRKEIMAFLTPLQQFQTVNSRHTLLFGAGLDAVLSYLDLSGSAGEFVARLVQYLEQFGTLSDGTPALVQLLQEVKTPMGQDKQKYIEDICERYKKGSSKPFQSPSPKTSVTPPPQTNRDDTKWDIFISHASEDKEEIAWPLAEALQRAGLRVWYDEFSLKLGDSLRRTIEQGLRDSRFGLVILSPNFFAKEWPQRELDGLTAREVQEGKVILPVWHKVSPQDVLRFSPVLADKLGVSTAQGLDRVVQQILQLFS